MGNARRRRDSTLPRVDPAHRVHRVRAKRVVLAAGAHERPLVYSNNDVPGNMLAGVEVIEAMVPAFEQATGTLADRLLAAMHAAMAAGGEAGPVHSAALSIVGEPSWPIVDLRVDWADDDPLGQLDHLWQAYRPQMQDYVTRALNPTAAPSYGVPGNE